MNNLNELTINAVTLAAEKNADRYVDRAKNIAKQAFIDGVVWATKLGSGKTQEGTV
jgi:hypothetical protein